MKEKIIIFCIVIIIGVYGFDWYNNYQKEQDKTYKNTPGIYDLEVEPNVIKETYKNNELDGNKKYFGKRIKVTDKYEKVETFLGDIMLYLDDVYCDSYNSEKDKEKLSTINKGQIVTVIGTGDGYAGTFKLKDCEIIEIK